MRVRSWVAALLLGVSLSAVAAEKVEAPASEALDAEFLEYLATFEGADEDWTWFADAADKQPAASQDAKQSQSAAKPAAEK